MKHTIFSAALLIILLLFCIYSAFYVSNATTAAEVILMRSVAYYRAGAEDAAAEHLNRAAELWRSHETMCGIVLKHEDLDEITREFSRLLSYAHTGDGEEFLSGCEALRETLRHVREMEWPLIQNIL